MSDGFLCQDLNKRLARWFSTRLDARYIIMSMHKSFRTDTKTPPGQVLNQGKSLLEEIKVYQKEISGCRCVEPIIEKCDNCPQKGN